MWFRRIIWLSTFILILALQACGGGGGVSGTTSTGGVNLSLTDAPGDFDNVYITVSAVRFHKSDVADPRAGDWLWYRLASPVTVDLLSLANGNMQALWNNIQLPIGTYKQIRLHLVPTFNANPPAGHQYFNEVAISGTTYPLIVPDADDGIKLVGSFAVTDGGSLKLAIDFNASEDIVEFHEGAGADYVLKPRLAYFDLDHAGAIIGKLSTSGSITAPRFVIKAERLATAQEMLDSGSTATYHVIRRWTVPRADGTFILFPVSTRVTSTWDVVIRGLNTETMIIKGVPVANGTTPISNATDLSTISTSTTSSPDYPVAGTIQSPTGAWVQFYQTLPGPGEYPYEIRFRDFNPLWGGFHQTFYLNNDQIKVADFVSSGSALLFSPVSPANGIGQYDAVAGALLYQRSTPSVVTSSTTTVAFTTLNIISPYTLNSVTGVISLGTNTMMFNKMNGNMNSGLLFAVHGGMIVNTLNGFNSTIGNQMVSGGSYTITLPGGFPGAFYGIDAAGWQAPLPSIYKAIGIPQIVDLRTGNDTADIDMLPLW